MSDRYANPFSAPRIHFLVAPSTSVSHPQFGETRTRRWIACGNSSASVRATSDRSKVTCLRCLDAIKRDGL